MAKLHAKVIKLLSRHFENVDDALDDLPGGRVSGAVISSSFSRMPHQERQDRLWKILRAGLSEDELEKLGAIVALTPAEANVRAP